MADLPTQRDFDDFGAWSGRDVLAPDGERLGAVELIFLDEATGVPEWVLVGLGDEAAFVPLVGAVVEERSIRVGQERDRVAAAPRVEAGDTLSVGDEKRLYEHYGLEYSREASTTVLPEGAGGEQEERPRLRKHVGAPVTEPVGEEPTATAAAAAAATPDAAAPEAATPEAAASPEPTAATPEPAASPGAAATPDSAANRMAPRNIGSATASTLPPAAPHVIPPTGGFQAEQPGGFQAQQPAETTSRRRLGISAALGGALAGLIAVLLIRRARR